MKQLIWLLSATLIACDTTPKPPPFDAEMVNRQYRACLQDASKYLSLKEAFDFCHRLQAK